MTENSTITHQERQELDPVEASQSHLDPLCIRERAFAKWESAGCPCGDGVEFWLEAEAELLAEAQSENSNQTDD